MVGESLEYMGTCVELVLKGIDLGLKLADGGVRGVRETGGGWQAISIEYVQQGGGHLVGDTEPRVKPL